MKFERRTNQFWLVVDLVAKRLPSLKRGAKDGIKMMIGLVPIFFMAAFPYLNSQVDYVFREANAPAQIKAKLVEQRKLIQNKNLGNASSIMISIF